MAINMPITPIGLRSTDEEVQSECASSSPTTRETYGRQGCEKALAVPGAIPKSAAKRMTPIGLRENWGQCQPMSEEDQMLKRRKNLERPQVLTPRMQVASGMKNSAVTASHATEATLGDGDMWLSRIQDLPPDRLNGWVVSWISSPF